MDIFFDESGNTGTNLLEPSQPIFALACTNIDVNDARKILDELRSQGQTEIKYSKLKKGMRGRRAVLELLRSEKISSKNSWAWATDKRFSLVAQLVDKAIEPAMYADGIDIYQRDMAANLATVIHFSGPHAFPNGRWENVLQAWENALLEMTPESYQAFDVAALDAVRNSRPDMKVGMFLRVTIGNLSKRLKAFQTTASFDPAVASFVSLVSHYMTLYPSWVNAFHDESKPMKQLEATLRKLMARDATPSTIGYPGKSMELPLRINDVFFESSKIHPQLQIADVIAGAAADCVAALIGYRVKTDYHNELMEVGMGSIIVGVTAALSEITPGPSPKDEDVSLVDGMAKFLGDFP